MSEIYNKPSLNDIFQNSVQQYIKLLIDSGHSGLIVGPTKSGKTTMLDLMIDLKEKPCTISIIEDVSELRENKKNSQVILDKKISNNDRCDFSFWLYNALRCIPDMMLFGELRLNGNNCRVVKPVLESGNTIITTMHAADAPNALGKLNHFDFTKGWKWIVSMKKSDNKFGFEIDSIHEIISKKNNVKIISIFKSEENISFEVIMKKTHHLKTNSNSLKSILKKAFRNHE